MVSSTHYSEEQIGLLRLAAHRITTSRFTRPDDAVRHMVAMQAQDYNGGLWSVGLRTNDATQKDVEQDIIDRKIVRTWPMRGTLHFVHTDDIHWLLATTAGRATAMAKSRRIQQLGLSDTIVEKAEAIVRSELAGGTIITRSDMTQLLKEKITAITISNQHVQHLMRNFGERGVICFGPHREKQPTFVLLDDWIGKRTVEKTREDALAELAKRYFTSHGPATLKDFSGWGMLTVADAKAGLAAVRADLRELVINDTVYYCAPDCALIAQPDTLLLPGFDEYVLGYKQRDAILQPEYMARVVPGNNGMFLATVVEDGIIVGTWKKTVKKDSISFTYNNFEPHTSPQLNTKRSEDRYRQFLSLSM